MLMNPFCFHLHTPQPTSPSPTGHLPSQATIAPPNPTSTFTSIAKPYLHPFNIDLSRARSTLLAAVAQQRAAAEAALLPPSGGLALLAAAEEAAKPRGSLARSGMVRSDTTRGRADGGGPVFGRSGSFGGGGGGARQQQPHQREQHGANPTPSIQNIELLEELMQVRRDARGF